MPPASGVSTGSSPRTRRTTSAASAVSSGSDIRSWSVELPTDVFSSSGVPSATLMPRSMTAIRSASWSASSRYWVVSSTVLPSRISSRMVSHIWPRVRGSRPVVGSSRKISGGCEIRLAARSSRRRMPPEKVEICLSRASVRPKRSSRSDGRAFDLAEDEALQATEEPEVLRAGEVLVDRGVLPGDADELADHVGVPTYVDAEDAGLAAVHRQQGGEHLEGGGLARAVGAEHAEDLAATYLEVDPVDRSEVAEGLDEPGGRDGQVGVRNLCHGPSMRGARFRTAFTPVSVPVAGLSRSSGSVATCMKWSDAAWDRPGVGHVDVAARPLGRAEAS